MTTEPSHAAASSEPESAAVAATASRRPWWPERLGQAVFTTFALWTVICHALVYAGASLRTQIAAFTAVGALVLMVRALLARAARRRGRAATARPAATVGDGPEGAPLPFELPPGWRWTLAAAGAAGALAFGRPDDALLLWWAVMAVLVLATTAGAIRGWSAGGESPTSQAPSTPRAPRRAPALLALALVTAATVLVIHRANEDDAFYVGLAVSAVDAPRAAMIAGDPMHGVEGLPLYISIYRLHTYEMACAAVSYLTGLPAISVFHLLAAAFFGFLMPLAHAALFRHLLPRHWLLATAVAMAVLLAPADANRWYGQLAFGRLWQGKSVFVSVLTPLLYLWAMRFAARPSAGGWLRLAAGQVAAVGLTSSALWAAPVAVALGLATELRRSVSGLRTLAAGLTSSTYLVVVGLAMRSSVKGTVNPAPSIPPAERIAEALAMFLGDSSPRLWTVAALAVAVAWAVVPAGRARRFALLVPLGAWGILLNPYLGDLLMAHVTHRPHWRAMWALPTAMLIALVMISPLWLLRREASANVSHKASPEAPPGDRRRPLRLAVVASLVALYVLFVPQRYLMSSANQATLAVPGLKVSPTHYDRARAVTDAFAPGELVAAPPDVNVWLPTFHDRVRPLLVRFYLLRLGAYLPEGELERRQFLCNLARGETDWAGAPLSLGKELEAWPAVTGVALPPSPQREAYGPVLESIGFSRLPAEAAAPELELWRRGGRP